MIKIIDYVNNRDIRDSAGWMKVNGKEIYIVNGKHLSAEEMDNLFPVDGKLVHWNHWLKGENPDLRKNYLNNKKSY